MDILERLRLLSEDSQYDLACACGTGKEDRRRRGLEGKWLYPVTLPNGGYSILLKTLLSNSCSNDCGYCPLRAEKDLRRCTLQPEEVARVFMDYVRQREVFGLFLSSGVIGTPELTMEKINAVASILRKKYRYRGYIHLKIIPGASDAAVEESVSLASAVSLNIETPGNTRFRLLSQKKDYMKDIIRPIKLMSRLTDKGNRYERVKCTTQFIVGASDERDSEIIDYTFSIYKKLRFQRVYFSAYQKGLGNPGIPGEQRILEPDGRFMREHRLYQTDFLIRKYGFTREEIILGDDGNLRLDKDPKEIWAETHPEHFPLRINRSGKGELLKVPGLGPETVSRIIKARKEGRISRLEDLGLKGKRLEKAQRYLICE